MKMAAEAGGTRILTNRAAQVADKTTKEARRQKGTGIKLTLIKGGAVTVIAA
jgi:hypothetical protein